MNSAHSNTQSHTHTHTHTYKQTHVHTVYVTAHLPDMRTHLERCSSLPPVTRLFKKLPTIISQWYEWEHLIPIRWLNKDQTHLDLLINLSTRKQSLTVRAPGAKKIPFSLNEHFPGMNSRSKAKYTYMRLAVFWMRNVLLTHQSLKADFPEWKMLACH